MKNSILLKIILSVITLVVAVLVGVAMFNSQWWGTMNESICMLIIYLVGTVTGFVLILIWFMKTHNYVCVSFYSSKAGESKDLTIYGSWTLDICGKTSFKEISEKLAEVIVKENKNYSVLPENITVTGINEISKELYKRLSK